MALGEGGLEREAPGLGGGSLRVLGEVIAGFLALSVGAIIVECPARRVVWGSGFGGGSVGVSGGAAPLGTSAEHTRDPASRRDGGLSCGLPVSPSFWACSDSPCGFSHSFPERR